MGQGLAEFADFFVEFGEDAVEVVPIEADAGGFARELEGLEKSGKSARDAVEERGRGRRGKGRYRGVRFGEALLGLDDFPVAKDFGGVLGALVAEDVGMAANHFLVDFGDDIGNGETAFFVSDLGVEKNLKEEVAKLFGEFGVVGTVESVENFVSFLDEVGAQGGVGLLAVPGAAVGSAETCHDGDEF